MSRLPTTPQSLASDLDAGWERALSAGGDGVGEWSLGLAEREVRLRIIGGSLADQLLPPLEHLRPARPTSGPADLSIDVWDATSDASALPSDPGAEPVPPWRASADGRVVTYRFADSTTALDRQAGRVVVAFTGAPSLSSRGRPFSYPIRLWLADRRVQVLHAGLVAKGGRGVLFGGAGGSGKSTAALACLRGGFDYLGDDYVGAARDGDGEWRGYSLYGSAYLEPDHLRRTFPDITGAISGDQPDDEKLLVLTTSRLGDQMPAEAAIAALVLPRPSRLPAARITPADKGAALLRVAPSSVLGSPRTHRDSFDDVARLVGAVPCFWLDLGPDATEIPQRVDEVLSTTIVP